MLHHMMFKFIFEKYDNSVIIISILDVFVICVICGWNNRGVVAQC